MNRVTQWKSTIAGLAGALAVAWTPMIDGELDWKRFAVAGLVAVLGAVSKW